MRQLLFVLALLSAFLVFAESEEETIGKCLRDLQSSDLSTRRAAALVIGKYNSDEAKAALLRCLNDPDAGIRQSALVSLTEDERRLLPETSQAILRMLTDEDVHIRRIASSLLDKAAGGNRIIGSRIVIRGQLRQPEALQQPDTIKYLNLALQDSDPSVRRNILLAAGNFPGVLRRENLESFFVSDSAELQALALRAYARCQDEEELRALQVQPLLNSPHTAVRFELVYLAANLGPAGLPLLEELAKDPDAQVRLAAIGILANDITEQNLARLKGALLDESLPAELRAQLITPLRRYAEQALPVCAELLGSGSAALRVAALRMLAFQKPETVQPQIFLDALADNSPEARQLAMLALRRGKSNLSAEKIKQVFHNPHADVRALAFRLTEDPAILLELAQQSLLDEEPLLRKSALQIYARQRPEGFQEMLLAALEDQDISIQEQAALSLLPFNRNQEVFAALQKYLDITQNQQLKARLQRMPKIPPARK